MEDKNVLVVWGGYGMVTNLKFLQKLVSEMVNFSKILYYKIYNGVEACIHNYEELIKYDLIIQSITMGEMSSGTRSK